VKTPEARHKTQGENVGFRIGGKEGKIEGEKIKNTKHLCFRRGKLVPVETGIRNKFKLSKSKTQKL